MDHDADRNMIYVHALAGADPEAVVAPIRRWEDYALVIFDEPRKPGDPVPEPETDTSPDSADSPSEPGGEQDGE